jgi:hypothetical protein
MVGFNYQNSIQFSLGAGAGAAHGFEPPHMRLGEGCMGGVSAPMGGSDLSLSRVRPFRVDRDDGTCRCRFDHVDLTNVDVVGAAVDGVDDRMVPMVHLIG